MTAEELEELEELLTVMNTISEGRADAEFKLKQLGPSLARKVIAAEKLVEALGGIERNLSDGAFYALTAYRESSK